MPRRSADGPLGRGGDAVDCDGAGGRLYDRGRTSPSAAGVRRRHRYFLAAIAATSATISRRRWTSGLGAPCASSKRIPRALIRSCRCGSFCPHGHEPDRHPSSAAGPLNGQALLPRRLGWLRRLLWRLRRLRGGRLLRRHRGLLIGLLTGPRRHLRRMGLLWGLWRLPIRIGAGGAQLLLRDLAHALSPSHSR